MVISHKYKYVFIGLPLTGSSTISTELCKYYDGIAILKKHSTYNDFLKIATDEEKKYFVFSCIRNPLDRVVSHYFKYKTDHKGKFSSVKNYIGFNPLYNHFKRRYNYVQDNNIDFIKFFKKFYKMPYSDWSILHHHQFNYVLRFENIVDDFSKVLKMLNIEIVRPLPRINKTNYREDDYLVYYTDDIIPRAKKIFGPFMKEWGYNLPNSWGNDKISNLTYIEYHIVNLLRKIYWKYIK